MFITCLLHVCHPFVSGSIFFCKKLVTIEKQSIKQKISYLHQNTNKHKKTLTNIKKHSSIQNSFNGHF